MPQVHASLDVRIRDVLNAMLLNPGAPQFKDLIDVHQELINEVSASKNAEHLARGLYSTKFADHQYVNQLLNVDPMLRLKFARNFQALHSAHEAIGLIDNGSTGKTGRQNYTSAYNAFVELYNEEQAKMKGPNKFEDAAEGVMYHRVRDYLIIGIQHSLTP